MQHSKLDELVWSIDIKSIIEIVNFKSLCSTSILIFAQTGTAGFDTGVPLSQGIIVDKKK